MKLAFLPGQLFLTKSEHGDFTVTFTGQEILKTRSQKLAISKFNELRLEMEARYPARELTAEEKAEMLQKTIGDELVGHNSLGGRKKKSTARSTRTFGG